MSFAAAGAAIDLRVIAAQERCTPTFAAFDSLAANDSFAMETGPARSRVRFGSPAAGGNGCARCSG